MKKSGLGFVFVSAFSIIGAIVGVGFVSGREIVSFFFVYGEYPVTLGVITACFLCFAVIKSVLNNNAKLINRYYKNCKNAKLWLKYGAFVSIKHYIFGVLEIASASVMIAGLGELLVEMGNKNLLFRSIMVISILVLLFFVIEKCKNKISRISGVISFVLICIMIICIIINLEVKNDNNLITENNNKSLIVGVINSIFYVSMNMLSSAGVIKNIRENYQDKKQVIIIGAIVSSVFLVLVFLIIFVFKNNTEIINFSMPLLVLTRQTTDIFYYIYFGAIMIGCLCSLMNVCYSGVVYFEDVKCVGESLKIIIYLACAFVLSFAGFKFLVSYIYPAVGLVYLLICLTDFAIFKIASINQKTQNNAYK